MFVKRVVVYFPLVFFCLSSQLLEAQRLRLDAKAYLWMASLTSSIESSTQSIRTKNRNIFNNLQPGATGALKLYGKNWFLLDDLMYLGTSNHVIDRIAVVPEQIIDMHSRGTFLANTLVGGVHNKKPFPWSLFLGARCFFGRLKLTALPPASTMVIKRTEKWPVPIIGAGIGIPFCKRLILELTGDIGMDKSYVNWQITPLLTWKIIRTCAVDVGYRFMNVQHPNSTLMVKSKLNGMFAGIRATF